MSMLGVVVAAMLAAGGPARPIGLTERTAERLQEAAEAARRGDADGALRQYQKLIEDSGDEWVMSGPAGVLRPCRVVALHQIAATPSLRRAFIRAHEETAGRLLESAKRSRSTAELDDLIRRYWPTSAAGEGLDVRGEWAFERGELAEARSWWRLAAGPGRPGEFTHPDAERRMASARARSILAGRMIGESVAGDLDAFVQQFPGDRGRLIGQDGVFADLLRSAVTDRQLALPPRYPLRPQTLGVDAARRGVLAPPLPTLAPRLALPRITFADLDDETPPPRRLPAVHPVFFRGKLVVCVRGRLRAYDPATGELLAEFSGSPAQPPDDTANLLTANDDFVVARTGTGMIVVLSSESDDDGFRWKQVGRIPTVGLGANARFEGCPVVVGTAALTSWVATEGQRSVAHIGMFPLAGGAAVWTRAVAELDGEPDAVRAAGRLLTVAGRNVVYSTDAGLIVALDRDTGRPAWAYRYPSRGPRGLTAELMPPPRDVCPPVADAGRLFAAPSDTDEIFALDAFTGVPLWDRAPVAEVVHLAGVADGRLIVTADGALTGVGAIDVATGRFVPTWGSLRGPRPGGRPIILGNAVVVPTRTEGLMVIDRDGRPAYPPALFRAIPAGNVAYADGLLVAATGTGLFRIRFDSVTPPAPARPSPPRGPITRLPPLHLGTGMALLWETSTPVAERPLGVIAGRLVAARGTTVVVRSLPAGDVVANHDVGFEPTGMTDRLILGQDRLAELRDDHTVAPLERRGHAEAAIASAGTDATNVEATAAAAARRQWGDGACLVAEIGGGRIFVGQPEARWAWTELAPATHRWTGLIVDAGNATVLDRVDVPAHGRPVAVGSDGATLVVAVVGSVRGLGQR